MNSKSETRSFYMKSSAVDLNPAIERAVKVLHVDDDPDFLKISKQVLAEHGSFQVDTAFSVDEAMDKMRKTTYDAVVSDYEMPGKDGLQFLKELREKGCNVPFIILTGKGREEVAIKALNLGADQYIDKDGYSETVYAELRHNIKEAVERRNAAQMLKESEEKYRNLVEGSKDSIVIIDLKGNVLFANKATEELTGYTDRSVPINLRKVTPIKYWPKSLAMLIRARRGESIPYFESVIKRRDGALVPVESGGEPLFRNGRVVGIQIITRDISARKQKEDGIRESEKKYRKLADQLPEVIFETDTQGKLTFLNKRAYEITGYTQEDFAKGLSVFEFITPHDRDKTGENLKKLLSGEKMGTNEYSFQYSFQRKDGSTFPVLIRSNPVVREGKVVSARGIIIDITEPRRAEQELQRFYNAVKMSLDGIVITDSNGRITEANDAATRFYRVNQKEDLVGKNVLELVDPQQRELVSERMKEATEKGPTKPHEYCIGTASGNNLSVELTITAMKDREGNPHGFVYIARDLTERKKAEESVRESEKRLEVVNEKLRVVGELTRHDVRNKLSAIVGNVYLSKKKMVDDPETLENLKNVESACSQIVRILDFAKAYEMLGAEELTYVNVEKAVQEAVSLFTDLNGVMVKDECEGLTVLADSLLRQLFYNLIDNSVKHGRKVSQIRTHYEIEGDRLRLFYEDNGVGMLPEAKTRIFQRGYTTGAGSGYGLHLIRKITEAYGWAIEETGKPDEGARFVVTIPRTNPEGSEKYRILSQ